MPTSVPGNPDRIGGLPLRTTPKAHGGFTLLELLLVVTLMALASAGVSLALRDSTQKQLDLDAQRLASVFNTAHAQARSTGVPVSWQASAGGVTLGVTRLTWSQASTQLTPLTGTLHPEPLLPPLQLTLRQESQVRMVGTNGVRPFQVLDPAPAR